MKKITLNQMEKIQGGGCVGAVLGSIAVTAAAGGLACCKSSCDS